MRVSSTTADGGKGLASLSLDRIMRAFLAATARQHIRALLRCRRRRRRRRRAGAYIICKYGLRCGTFGNMFYANRRTHFCARQCTHNHLSYGIRLWATFCPKSAAITRNTHTTHTTCVLYFNTIHGNRICGLTILCTPFVSRVA